MAKLVPVADCVWGQVEARIYSRLWPLVWPAVFGFVVNSVGYRVTHYVRDPVERCIMDGVLDLVCARVREASHG